MRLKVAIVLAAVFSLSPPLLAIGAAQQKPLSAKFAVMPITKGKRLTAGDSLACNSIGTTSLNELLVDSAKIEGSVGPGLEKVFLRIAPGEKALFLMADNSVPIGTTNYGDAIPVTLSTPTHIFASRTSDGTTDAIVIDRTSHRVLWSITKVSQLIGLYGQSDFFDCR